MANTKNGCEIWAIGGGKGGIGKSFVISSLGTYLAGKGNRVILIDADLGGANLHNFLGLAKPRASLSDFFDKKKPLAQLVVPSAVDNLGLLTGAIGSLDPDHIKYTQKLKFFNHIKSMKADYILIDLGAGTHFNTIDTFLLADKFIVVTVPELTAIENFYFFLKNTFFRKLARSCTEGGLRELLRKAWLDRRRHQISNFVEFLSHLRTLSPKIGQIIDQQLASFNLQIIVNQLRHHKDITIGNSLRSVCKKYYGLNAQYVGYIEHDDIVSRCINQRHLFMQAYPSSRCAKEIERVAENLLEGKQLNI